MEILRHAVLFVHLIGFALLFGGWFVEVVQRTFRVNMVMNLGMIVAFVAGLALSAPWGVSYDLNYTKIGVKLVVLIVIGALMGISSARAKKDRPLPVWTFWAIGALTLLNAGLGVMWR
ncbi:Fe-S protein [Microbacterium halophytorum]|uniref:Fe-S protein n=1 Tax=Microbacterium halophytorum TaxID=2067568 RepID=UPI000CFE2FF5|nr:Fe-S protein [Microbacterium halophytorum]